MAEDEWYHILRWRESDEKDEQIRDLRVPSIHIDDDSFTVPDVVPMISVNDEEDDFGEEEE